jgi:predicted nucleotidyltransferase
MKTPVRTIDPEANVVLDRVVNRVSRIRGVAAIVLGGSHARGTADLHSDIDLGIYYHEKNPFRIAALERAARDLDDRGSPGLVTRFGEWGPGVNGGGWLRIGGRQVDFLYRELGAVRRSAMDCRAGRVSNLHQLGHPMGFHSQIHAGELSVCIALHDPRGVIRRLKRLVTPYPEALRRTLVARHFFDATFHLAIADKPAKRGDVTYVAGSMFHAAGLLMLVLYALNRRWLINEKGALPASRDFEIAPRGFHSTIESVMAAPGHTPRELARNLERMRAMAAAMGKLAAREGFEVSGFGP